MTTLIIAIFALPFFVQAETWYVQVGVFEQQVDIDYFNVIGSDIHHSQDSYGFHRYYKGAYTSESEAKQMAEKFKDMGYHTVLTAKSELENSCVCNYIPMPESQFNSIKNIFFDFDKSNLRTASIQELNDLISILNTFPSYRVNLRAHTDSKGSNSYNEALSLRRANAAKRYLISRGIAASRLDTETFGEVNPIAKNELNNGVDTEQGRQFNRRVEILIMNSDGHVMNEMVDEIEVPAELLSSN